MIESARFYEEKSEGLGSDFLAAVEETTRRIEHLPEAGLIGEHTFASDSCPAFLSRSSTKYSLIIAAVMHQHRRPGYWRTRVG